MGNRRRRPVTGQLVLVVNRSQAGGVEFPQGGCNRGHTDGAGAVRGQSGGELVDALGPTVA
jgi:hypothetical protein